MNIIQNSNGCVKFTDTSLITYDLWNKILHRFQHLGYTDLDIDRLISYISRGVFLQPDQSQAVLTILNGEHTRHTSIQDAAKRLQAAIKTFGLTERPELAGYLMPDGRMLNFSYEGYIRDIDHRDIKDAINMDNGIDAMNTFINDGNIRLLGYSGFETQHELTNPQKRTLSKIIRQWSDGYVDIANNNGIVVKHLEYTYGFPSQVFDDIDAYFQLIA